MLAACSFTQQSYADELIGARIASIKNRATDQELVYTRDGKTVRFYLSDAFDNTLLKEVTVENHAGEIVLNGKGQYNFNLIRGGASALAETTQVAYWCVVDADCLGPWTIGVGAVGGVFSFLTLGTSASIVIASIAVSPLILPALPAAAIGGVVLLAPYELIRGLTDKENRAIRKFNKLMNGKSTKVSDRVFDVITSKIIEI